MGGGGKLREEGGLLGESVRNGKRNERGKK